jgi:hypothetical protein
MKKLILIVASLFVLNFSSSAQMTLEHAYYNGSYAASWANSAPLEVVNLLLSGKKYAEEDMLHSKVILYHLNHSLWQTINLPTVINSRPTCVYYISENLFKIDGLVDMVVSYTDTITDAFTALVIDQTGAIINTFSNSLGITIYNTSSGVGADTLKAIVWQNTGYFHMDTTSMAVYSLPGTIPCSTCGSGTTLGIVSKVTNNNSGSISDPIPNPNNGSVRIDYTLPENVNKGEIVFYNSNGQRVKSYAVFDTAPYLLINNLQLPSSIYYYCLIANDVSTTSKKMITIH